MVFMTLHPSISTTDLVDNKLKEIDQRTKVTRT